MDGIREAPSVFESENAENGGYVVGASAWWWNFEACTLERAGKNWGPQRDETIASNVLIHC